MRTPLIFLFFSLFLLLGVLLGLATTVFVFSPAFSWPETLRLSQVVRDVSLDKYAFENLKTRPYPGGRVELGPPISKGEDFESRLFYFYAEGKKISGQINIPEGSSSNQKLVTKKFPVVLMLRGYVDKEIYQTGMGTRRVAAVLAENGFVTLAPDFLGYGASDADDPNPLIARFETYVAAINLINSINSLPFAISNKLFLWGHSNGGQIALSVLEITGESLPTVLWAPVSKPFPYSILFYSIEASDSGKLLRKIVANFDRNYDGEKYSLTSYLDWISAPLQIDQGLADEAVPPRWTKDLVEKLKELKKEVSYYEYDGSDHNLSGSSWSLAVTRDLEFFNSFLNEKQ